MHCCCQHQQDKVASFYYPIRQKMSSTVKTDISHLLAARDGLCLRVFCFYLVASFIMHPSLVYAKAV